MSLVVYNTQSRRKEPFEPLDPGHVRFYVCGPTVYDRAHIGNARPVIVFDVLYRLLKRLYPRVTYARNITDVDDKINAAAKANGEPISALTARTIAMFHDDMARLGARPPDVEPRATEHIPQMIELIQRLLDSGHAYRAEGHVLFDVSSMADYGKLSGRDRRELIAGARIEVAPYKKDAADFVLWKPSGDGEPGWESPWGRGRPGWHLECSAMSQCYLGESFDIHGGGSDLIFPHHENELAQSECAHHGRLFVKYWMHNGFLSVEGEKMSKSLGNVITVAEALDWAPGEALRLLMLATHYRHPLDFTRASLRAAKRKLDHWYRAVDGVADGVGASAVADDLIAALEDDLNTPKAIAVLDRLYAETKLRGGQADIEAKKRLLASARFLGLLERPPVDWFRWQPAAAAGPSDAEIEALIAEREKARKAKDFAAADRIRDDLAARGVVLEDGAGGTTWRRA